MGKEEGGGTAQEEGERLRKSVFYVVVWVSGTQIVLSRHWTEQKILLSNQKFYLRRE